MMVSRGKVPSKRPNGHEQQDREADEHVRAVQAGEAVEDRPEGAVVRRKAHA